MLPQRRGCWCSRCDQKRSPISCWAHHFRKGLVSHFRQISRQKYLTHSESTRRQSSSRVTKNIWSWFLIPLRRTSFDFSAKNIWRGFAEARGFRTQWNTFLFPIRIFLTENVAAAFKSRFFGTRFTDNFRIGIFFNDLRAKNWGWSGRTEPGENRFWGCNIFEEIWYQNYNTILSVIDET